MSLTGTFNPAPGAPGSGPADAAPRRKRPAPFSVRLSELERTRLAMEAAGAPLGAYIKAKILGGPMPAPVRTRRSGLSVQDRKALAQLVAILGQTRLFSNLNQLAKLANCGALPVTPEVEAELVAALEDLRAIRHLLLVALGLKPEGRS